MPARDLGFLVALAAALAWPGAATADEDGANERDRSTERTQVLVTGGAGTYEVVTHPRFITNLYFPDKLEKVLSSDRRSFRVMASDSGVALSPRRLDTELVSNLTVRTASMRVTVIVRITDDPREAMTQVDFRHADVAELVNERVEKKVKARVESLRASYPRRFERDLATRLLGGFRMLEPGAIDRSDDNIVVRAKRAVQIDDDVFLFFSVENRGRDAYRLAAVHVLHGETPLSGQVVVQGQDSEGVVAAVAPGEIEGGVVVIRGGAAVAAPVTLVAVGAAGDCDVRVGAISLR